MSFRVVLVLAVFVLSGAARAQEAPPPEIADQVELCSVCHGKDGRPVNADTPVIWGQEEYYIYVQMRDIQAGRRASEVMLGVVADLTRDQMKALGKYFSRLPWPSLTFQVQEGDEAIASKMAAAGQCSQCHLSGFDGDSRIPRAANQTASYLEKTMLDFKYRRRMNAPDKASLMETFSDADIAAMARHMASLQPR
jgi:cytochrome c553